MLYKTKGVVLHYTKYSETSVIVKIYTELFGIQTYLIRGVRKQKSKVKLNLLQHVSLVDMVVYHKEKSSINHIKEIQSAYQFKSIPFDIRKSSIAIFINEVLYKSIHEEEANKKMFDFIFNSIKILDLMKDNFNNFHLLFLVILTKHLGFFPKTNFSDDNSIFNLIEGVFQSFLPEHAHYIQKPHTQYLNKLLFSSYEDLSSIKIPSTYKTELLDKLIEYYQLHLPNFKDINSHKILQNILH